MAKSSIEQREGKTVLVTEVESEDTARQLGAAIDGERVRIEGNWLERLQQDVDEVLAKLSSMSETVDRSWLLILSLAFGFVAAVLAARAWPAFLPIDDLAFLIALIGVLLVLAIAICAHQVYRAHAKGDEHEFYGLVAGIVLGVVLNVLASISLQSQLAASKATGWEDVQAQIETLRADRGRLALQTYNPPAEGKAEAAQAAVDAFLKQGAVNRLGDTLPSTVGDLVGDCEGESNYYVGKYCPEILRLVALRDQARTEAQAYAALQSQIEEKDDEIARLEASRPKPQASLSLLRWAMPDMADLVDFIPATLLTLFIELMMILFSVLSGRRSHKRREAQ